MGLFLPPRCDLVSYTLLSSFPLHLTSPSPYSSVCAAYVTDLLAVSPELLCSERDRLARLWLRCWAGGTHLSELGPLTAAVAAREPLVPPAPPGDPATAREFADRLGRLAEQVKRRLGLIVT